MNNIRMHKFNYYFFEHSVQKKLNWGLHSLPTTRVPMDNILQKIKGMPPAVAHSTYGQRCVKDTMTQALLFVYV
jgi:hypothetical protein